MWRAGVGRDAGCVGRLAGPEKTSNSSQHCIISASSGGGIIQGRALAPKDPPIPSQACNPTHRPLAPTPHTKDCRDGSLTLMRPVTCKSAMPDAFGVSLSPSRVTGMVLTLLARSSANSAWCTFAVFKCEDAF